MYKLFVGGLPFSTSDDELAQIFGAHGAIASAVVVKDRDTGRSKGFGFVEFENDEEGKAAEKALHNSDLGGRAITGHWRVIGIFCCADERLASASGACSFVGWTLHRRTKFQ